MHGLFIAQGNVGSTSLGRYDAMVEVSNGLVAWKIVDSNPTWESRLRMSRWLKWRWKTGPLVWMLNLRIIYFLTLKTWSIVFVDKGVWLWPFVLRILKNRGAYLVHWTPDPAFHVHRSRKFNLGVRVYDKVYTTKEYELRSYYEAGAAHVVLVNQSIAPSLSSWREWDKRKWDYGFIGHFEQYRGDCIEKLLESGCRIAVGGYDWAPFASKYVHLSNFDFLGEEGLFSQDYHDFWSDCRIGLGFISHYYPDTITTRTFEIPAYHSVLCSPQTPELEAFFGPDNYPRLDSVLINPKSFLELDRLSSFYELQKEKIATSEIYHIDAMKKVLADWDSKKERVQ